MKVNLFFLNKKKTEGKRNEKQIFSHGYLWSRHEYGRFVSDT